MFTIEQIDGLHARLANAETLFEYVRALSALGIDKYDSYSTSRHSAYIGKHGHKVIFPPAHTALSIADKSDRENFLQHLELHEQGQTTHLEMSKNLAKSGIEKWTVDANKLTMVFDDKAGSEMLVERIE